MKTSIIIPTINNVSLLEDCVASLLRHVPEHEIVVVDNGSKDISLSLIGSDRLTYLRLPKNKGFAHACNTGAKVANGDNYLFLNNDTLCYNDFISPMLDCLEKGVGIVGNKLLFPDGSVQHAGIDLITDDSGEFRGMERREDHESDFVDAVTGACLLIRKQTFWEIGGFDEGYWNGNEDVDLCLKAAQANWKIYYQSSSELVHFLSQSGPERFSRVHQNVQRLNEKWKHLWNT